MFLRQFIGLLVIFSLISCGSSTEDEVDDAIKSANQHLSDMNCSKALSILNEVGFQNKNSQYLIAYASAQACKSKFSVIDFFANDLDSINTTDETSFLGSLASMSSSSQMTSPTDENFTHLFSAIETLLYAGGASESGHSNREAIFGADETDDMDVFNLYMILSAMGKFHFYYGKSSSNGTKGATAVDPSDYCYINYTDAAAKDYIDNNGNYGSCALNSPGNADLAGNRTRQCQGVILFNNFFDIINRVTLGTSNSGDLDDLEDAISNVCGSSTLSDPLGDTCTVKDLSTCVDDTTNVSNAHLERYYVVLVEFLHR